MQSKAQAQKLLERSGKVEHEVLYEGKIIDLRLDRVRSGERKLQWEIVVHPGAVVVVPVLADGRIVLVSQWRRAIEQIIVELPAGTLEEGEEPLVCADRELQEEIGYKAGRLTALGGYYSAPGFCTEYLHLFVAENLVESALEGDEDEGIDVVIVTLDEALKMIDDNRIVDVKSIAGLLRYARWNQK